MSAFVELARKVRQEHPDWTLRQVHEEAQKLLARPHVPKVDASFVMAMADMRHSMFAYNGMRCFREALLYGSSSEYGHDRMADFEDFMYGVSGC